MSALLTFRDPTHLQRCGARCCVSVRGLQMKRGGQRDGHLSQQESGGGGGIGREGGQWRQEGWLPKSGDRLVGAEP